MTLDEQLRGFARHADAHQRPVTVDEAVAHVAGRAPLMSDVASSSGARPSRPATRRSRRPAGPVWWLVAAAAAVVAIAVGFAVLGDGDETIRTGTLPATVPTTPSAPEPTTPPTVRTTAPSTAAATVPSTTSPTYPPVRMPRTTAGHPGVRGWVGDMDAPQIAGMHWVTGDRDSWRQVAAIVFDVDAHCLDSTSDAAPVDVTVAGMEAVLIEPFEPTKPFGSVGDEMTRGYGFDVADRKLCVFVTTHPTTTPDELAAVDELLETLELHPVGDSEVRLTFYDPGTWDTG